MPQFVSLQAAQLGLAIKASAAPAQSAPHCRASLNGKDIECDLVVASVQ
jgi:hypothetical protein